MIKYLGSKRTLVPALTRLAQVIAPRTALDMFTGTTRVARAFKQLGIHTTANDLASYSHVLAQCYIETDARVVDQRQLSEILEDLAATPGVDGYFTHTFCEKARFFQPHNGRRIDAMRERLENEFKNHQLFPVLLTSLMEAADRVDSTTGLQMAYLKNWAPRSYNDLELRVPQLLDGSGVALNLDANQAARQLPTFDLAYLDPPYNQHRYFTNYHIWETLVRWDRPETYGVAQKRVDAREERTKSAYNRRRNMPPALLDLLQNLPAQTVILSYNNESWLTYEQIGAALGEHWEAWTCLAFDYKRYVGAQIGIYNPAGQKVGRVSHLRNQELVFVAGPGELISRVEQEFAADLRP